MTIFLGIVGLILLLTAIVGGIWWIVDGTRFARGKYQPSKAEIVYSHIGFGVLITLIGLYAITSAIIAVVK
jgi:hypothetical protein